MRKALSLLSTLCVTAGLCCCCREVELDTMTQAATTAIVVSYNVH